MKFSVKVETLGDLVQVAGVPIETIAEELGLSSTIIRLKINGNRTMFIDECEGFATALNLSKRISVTTAQVESIIGKSNLKLRGYAG